MSISGNPFESRSRRKLVADGFTPYNSQRPGSTADLCAERREQDSTRKLIATPVVEDSLARREIALRTQMVRKTWDQREGERRHWRAVHKQEQLLAMLNISPGTSLLPLADAPAKLAAAAKFTTN